MTDPQQPQPGGEELDLILDAFSKAHPFADTRAYNIFHDQAKAAINAVIRQELRRVLESLKENSTNLEDSRGEVVYTSTIDAELAKLDALEREAGNGQA